MNFKGFSGYSWYYSISISNWGRVTHVRPQTFAIISSDNGRSPVRRQPLSAPMLVHCRLDPCEHISVKFESEYNKFCRRMCIRKCRRKTRDYFVRPQCDKVQVTNCQCMGAIQSSGSSDNRQFNFLFNCLFKLSTKKHQISALLAQRETHREVN